MTDQDIILHLQLNKYSSALKGLYSVLPAVKKYIKENNGSTDDAEDIFQDALVILYKKVQEGKFEQTAPLKNYLMAIVRNCWMQELRRRKKLPETDVEPEMAADELTDEESAYVFAKAAFGLLGEKCRQLLIMFYFKKESYSQIAAALSFADDKTAKNQKYRCLQKAKENYLQLSKQVSHE